jgi:hypothetical protein
LEYLTGFGAGSVGLQRVLAQRGDYALNPAAGEWLKAECTRLARRFLAGKPTDAALPMIAPYITHFSRGRQCSVDNSGGDFLLVSASGGLYPHPALAEQEEYRLGDVATGLDRGQAGVVALVSGRR